VVLGLDQAAEKETDEAVIGVVELIGEGARVRARRHEGSR
jgi:hypothetical protein